MLKLSGEARYRRMDEGTGWGALASGSFGKVYIAVDNHTAATVAVKNGRICHPTPPLGSWRFTWL
jgi:hypothetical protein